MPYDIFRVAKCDIISIPSYAEGIYHRTKVRYHTKGISPVPKGMDIIKKRQVSTETCRFFMSTRDKKDAIDFSLSELEPTPFLNPAVICTF